MTATPCIDHVIVLVPYSWLTSPPAWLSRNFVLSPGGRHADDKTENRLILFQDGSYLELIAFINDDPARRAGHWWDKPFGVVDWCLTTKAPTLDLATINTALDGSGVQYDQPMAGGRRRPDGTLVEWLVTFPRGVPRGLVPFWCHDKTPRHNRIPTTEQNTTHPCGAIGVNTIIISSDSSSTATAHSILSAITFEHVNDHFQLSRFAAVSDTQSPAVTINSTSPDLQLGLVLQLRGGCIAPESVHEAVGNGLMDVRFTV